MSKFSVLAQSKEGNEGKNQEYIQSGTTTDPGHHRDSDKKIRNINQNKRAKITRLQATDKTAYQRQT